VLEVLEGSGAQFRERTRIFFFNVLQQSSKIHPYLAIQPCPHQSSPAPQPISLTTLPRGVEADPVVLKLTPIKQVCGAENSADLFPRIKPPQNRLKGDKEPKFHFVKVCKGDLEKGG
jgi:hypothetical protein